MEHLDLGNWKTSRNRDMLRWKIPEESGILLLKSFVVSTTLFVSPGEKPSLLGDTEPKEDLDMEIKRTNSSQKK